MPVIPVKAASQRGVNKRKAARRAGRNNVLEAPSRKVARASAQVDASPVSTPRVPSFGDPVVSSAARTKAGTHVTSVDPGGTPAFTTYQPQQGVSAQFGTKPDIARLKVAQDRVDALRSRRDQGNAGSDSSSNVLSILYSRLCTTIIQESMWTPL